MNYEASGIIHVKGDTEQVTERFRKREFVLKLDGNDRYPQYVSFQLTGDRCEDLGSFEVGDSVQVQFSLRGREWTSRTGDVRYFNSLDVRRLELVSEGAGRGDGPRYEAPPADNFSDDDVPF